MDCRVVLEAAVPVYDVDTRDQAVRIAISKTGEMLNPDLSYVEISMADRQCDHCGEDREPAFIAADEGLVALDLEMSVFNVDGEQHATRIARKEIGQRLAEIPLDVKRVEELANENGETDDSAGSAAAAAEEQASGEVEDAAEKQASGQDTDAAPADETESDGDEPDILPEFEELIDE
jgi:uncharacterized protein (UPF0212 family)